MDQLTEKKIDNLYNAVLYLTEMLAMNEARENNIPGQFQNHVGAIIGEVKSILYTDLNAPN